MKKLIIINLIITILNTIFLITFNGKFSVRNVDDFAFINKCDTIINRVRIDSIEYFIISKDSIINNIKIETKNEIENANALSDTASVELFKQLVSK